MSFKHGSHAIAVRGIKLTFTVLKLLQEGKPVWANLPLARSQIRRKLWDLEQAGHVKKKEENYFLTSRGKYTLSEQRIWELTIPTPKKWDYRWRMLLYDIPVHKETQRHAFRSKLRELGLVLYQNSVWIYPYPMEEIIAVIADFYGIKDCVLFAVAEKLNGEKRLRKEFGL